MEDILVSVIMANYNTPIEYLKEAIESILNQTYSNFELIIIDDASTDESLQYIESIHDDRIVLVRNDKNMGPAVSRNKGLDIAKGKYIAIMDSDDISLPNRLQVELDYMESNPDVIVCGSWFEKFGVENLVRKPVIDDFELYRCQLLFSNTPTTMCHSTAMIRKSDLEKNHIRYDVSLPKAQDYGLWVVCSKHGKMKILPEVLLRYRTHHSQISIQWKDSQTVFSDLISRRQLQSLGIEFCDEESRWRYDNVIDKKDYKKFYNWIMSIKEANEKVQCFQREKLDDYLHIKLSNAIKRARVIDVLKIYFATNTESRIIIARLVKNSLSRRARRLFK